MHSKLFQRTKNTSRLFTHAFGMIAQTPCAFGPAEKRRYVSGSSMEVGL